MQRHSSSRNVNQPVARVRFTVYLFMPLPHASLRIPQDGTFCVFPRDYCLGEGETVTINAEYLPSRTGLHEARFLMLQASKNNK